jgi:hypothetical protein
MSSAEMTMVEALEKKWGEKIICGDNRGTREILRLRLNAPTELTSGIKEALSKDPKIKRILYQDSVAVAAALRLEDVLPGRKASIENIAEREFCESLKKLQENRSNFFEKLLFARSAVSFGVLSAEEVEKELSTAKKRWQKEQTLRGLEEVVGEGFFLPERATLDSLFEYTKGVFSDAAEKLMKRFSLIKNYLPKAGIPSKLWLGELRFSAIEEACLYDLRLIDFERAAGLMDDESLAVFSSTPSNSIETICDAAAQKELNRREFAEGAMPQKGYLELDPHTRILKRFHLAERLCSGIALENFVFQDTELAKKFEKRIYKKHCLFLNKNLPELWQAEEIKVLIKKHGEKNNPDLAFGENDNALDAVTSFTCRVWESLIKEPELAWYEVLKLQPLWTVEKSDASALWIGIWAHEALAQAKDDSSINAYFSLARLAQKDVFTVKAAWMSAWRLASSLWAKIKEVKTIAAEEEVEGFLEVKNVKIPLRGRIDRVVEDSSGRFLLLDFKKSSQPVSLKTLAEGDGLQLLLYARLFRKVQVGALCRLSPKDSLKPQATIDKELFECEKEMARIVATGILGARGEVWGRFGDEDRLPLASIPLSPKIINARRRKSGEEKR